MNVQKKAVHLIICNTIKKGFRRCKRPNTETVRRQKPLEALQHARIVFNDSYGAHAIARPDKLAAKVLYNRRRLWARCDYLTPQEKLIPRTFCDFCNRNAMQNLACRKILTCVRTPQVLQPACDTLFRCDIVVAHRDRPSITALCLKDVRG